MNLASILILSAILVIETATPGRAQSANPDIAAGGFGSATDKNAPVTTKATVAPMALTTGWNYKYCSDVWVSPSSKSTMVRIDNNDGSYFTYTTASASTNTYQQMMIRACRAQGQYYGVRITNTSTFAWDAIVAY